MLFFPTISPDHLLGGSKNVCGSPLRVFKTCPWVAGKPAGLPILSEHNEFYLYIFGLFVF